MLPLLAKAEFPKAPLDLQIQIGWLALLAVALILLWTWSRSESFRRAFFQREDPRMFAVWRIGLGIMTIQNFWNLTMHWKMLWTDEGMFTSEEVRGRLGRSSLAGWNEVDGFMDGWGVIKFFWGKYSLLFIESSPNLVIGYLVLLFVVLGLYTIGFRTRVTGVVALILINSLYNRNSVYMEGHDTVYRCLWFISMFCKTDGAWSVDNWIRRVRERRLNQSGGHGYDLLHLFDRASHWLWGGAFALWFCHFVDFRTTEVWVVTLSGVALSGVVGWVELMRRRKLPKLEPDEPVRFRRIPSWPRWIFFAQLICIYTATGLYKTGEVWLNGDALYYSLNMDHFYRFEGFTQWVSALFATSLFKVMSHVTHWWERCFGFIALGMILKWRLDKRDEPWFQAMEANKWRMWFGRLALIGSYLTLYRLFIIAYPWCIKLQPDKSPTPPGPGLTKIHVLFAVIIPLCVALWYVLGRWPIEIRKPAKLIALRERLFGKRESPSEDDDKFVFGQRFVRNWLLGRRIWLGLGLMFHGILLVFMNIGMFPVIMMWIYVVWFDSDVYLRFFRWWSDLVRRSKFTAWMAPAFLDDALREDSAILETHEAAWRRDPTGPWWLDPYKLFVAPVRMLRDVAGFDAEASKRGGRIHDAVTLGMGALLISLIVARGLEAKTEADLEAAKKFDPAASTEDKQKVREQRKAEAAERKDRIDLLADAGWWWVYGALAIAAGFHFRRRMAFDQPDEPNPTPDGDGAEPTPQPEDGSATVAEPSIMGGTLARTIVLGFTVWHCSAVGVMFIPKYSVTQAWRGECAKPFGQWVRAMNVTQSWKMFSPNPPRSNTFMRTVVVDHDGEHYQVGTDHYTNRPYVFWYNDRSRKMHRRMVGKSKWYLKYWGQYHCRDWAFNHDGELPKEVQVLKLKTRIPKPDKMRTAKDRDPRKRKLKRTVVETRTCRDSDIEPFMKERRGWPLSEADVKKLEAQPAKDARSAESKRRSWANREDFGGTPRDERDPEPTVPVIEDDEPKQQRGRSSRSEGRSEGPRPNIRKARP